MVIRRYKPGEEAEIWALYFNTTHRIVAQEYTQEQVHRWAPSDVDMAAWTQKLTRTKPFVAIENEQIVGFAELEEGGHIDGFYCHHQRQRQGIGTALLRKVEAEAASQGLGMLYAAVSTTGVRFFRAQGFAITEERTNEVCGVPAKQYLMEKRLAAVGT